MTVNSTTKDYSNGDIIVRWDAGKCYHAAECVKGLPKVFNPRRKPWIELEHSDSAAITEVVSRCPSGALSMAGDTAAAETSEAATVVTVVPNGPYRLKGNFTVTTLDGKELPTATAAALCACGQSSKKPFCDGTHKSLPGYTAPHKD